MPQENTIKYCTGPITRMVRQPDPKREGGTIVRLYFEAGGAVEIYTQEPLVWFSAKNDEALRSLRANLEQHERELDGLSTSVN